MEANAGSIGAIEHVAVVVRDLDRAMEHYTNDLGMGPWAVYTLSPDWIRDIIPPSPTVSCRWHSLDSRRLAGLRVFRTNFDAQGAYA